MKILQHLFTVYRVILYTAIILYIGVALIPMIVGIKPFMVLSASMEPTVYTGDLAYINTKDTDVEVDDIIAFYEGEGDKKITVIHRVNAFNEDGTLVTKGDNNENVDLSPIKPEQIMGTMVFNIPKLGFLTGWLQTKKGIIVAVVLVAIAFISSFITDEAEENKKNKTGSSESSDANEVSEEKA